MLACFSWCCLLLILVLTLQVLGWICRDLLYAVLVRISWIVFKCLNSSDWQHVSKGNYAQLKKILSYVWFEHPILGVPHIPLHSEYTTTCYYISSFCLKPQYKMFLQLSILPSSVTSLDLSVIWLPLSDTESTLFSLLGHHLIWFPPELMFFKLCRPKARLANRWRARAQIADNCWRNLFTCGNMSLMASLFLIIAVPS